MAPALAGHFSAKFAKFAKLALFSTSQAVERSKRHHIETRLNEYMAMNSQQSHSLGYLPSLTARQARRSGVLEKKLRERWV